MSEEYNKNNIPFAKELRKRSTKQEKHLWYDFLSKYNIRFQRQKAIDNYIADFYCDKAKLVIEIDGKQHYMSDKDLSRTKVLESYGIKIIRFTNKQIDTRFREVCEYIDRIVKERL